MKPPKVDVDAEGHEPRAKSLSEILDELERRVAKSCSCWTPAKYGHQADCRLRWPYA